MQERHSNREQYFKEQGIVTEKYVIPYINSVIKVTPDLVVAEIGCGEAGNMKPFLDMGCKVVGIDIASNKIENGKVYYKDHPNNKNLSLIADDIYNIDPLKMEPFDLIIMRDTIEHIHDQGRFMAHLRHFMKPDGKIFFGFPPWRMPFGGHQQICVSKVLSSTPYSHLLPRFMYKGLLKLFNESQVKIDNLMEVRDTGISINRFRRIVRENNFKIEKETFYFINPNYEIKFKLKARKLLPLFNIPWLRDFFTTTCYYVLSKQ